jgi:hypothetical protein
VVGVPEKEITLAAQPTLTPVGSPVAVPIPVAPVVDWVTPEKAELAQKVLDEIVPAVLFGVTVMVPTALTPPQPIKGML